MSTLKLPIRLDSFGLLDLGGEMLGDELKQAMMDCIDAQRIAARDAIARHRPDPRAPERVSADSLGQILSSNLDIHGIATEREISNVICFGAKHIPDAILDSDVEARRRIVDRLVQVKLRDLFRTWKELPVYSSGILWYPPGCAMGWHTNSKAPGWRIYLNFAEQEGESFFRYRDPNTREIITLMDKQWNFRVFRVTEANPLWHCIHSNTNRFSLGYLVKEPSFKQALAMKVRKLVS